MRTEIGPNNAGYSILGEILSAAGEPLCCGIDRMDTDAVGYPFISVYSDSGRLLGACIALPPAMVDMAGPSHIVLGVVKNADNVSGLVIVALLNAALRVNSVGVIMSVKRSRIDEAEYCQRVGAVPIDAGLSASGYDSFLLTPRTFEYWRNDEPYFVNWSKVLDAMRANQAARK